MNKKILKKILIFNIIFFVIEVGIVSAFDRQNLDSIDNKENGCFCLYQSNEEFETFDKNENRCFVMSDPMYIDLENIRLDYSSITTISTPEEFNWMEFEGEDWTTPAKNQGNCGSCWDFAAIGALESRINIREGNANLDPDLSEQYVLSCLPSAANHYGRGCWGGNPYAAYYYIMNTTESGNFCNGVITENCFNYYASHEISCSKKCLGWEENLVPIEGCHELWFDLSFDNSTNREIIKSEILLNGPVAATINVTQEFSNFGLYHHKSTDYFKYRYEPWANRINHIIVILGWKDDPSVGRGGYWICKNSWGSKWGYNGFFNIEYGTLFTGIGIIWPDYNPESYDWPPVADAGEFREIQTNEIITFDSSNSFDSEGEIISYEWDFGDGSSSSEFRPTHQYSDEGIYKLELIVTDEEKKKSTDEILIGVNRSPVDININGGMGFTIEIQNPSDYKLKNKTLIIRTDTLLINGDYRHKIIDKFEAKQTFTQKLDYLGLGLGTIDVIFEGITKSDRFILIGPFVLLI
jgi:C1A family cysteine protease